MPGSSPGYDPDPIGGYVSVWRPSSCVRDPDVGGLGGRGGCRGRGRGGGGGEGWWWWWSSLHGVDGVKWTREWEVSVEIGTQHTL